MQLISVSSMNFLKVHIANITEDTGTADCVKRLHMYVILVICKVLIYIPEETSTGTYISIGFLFSLNLFSISLVPSTLIALLMLYARYTYK